MSKVKIELNREGVKELMQSDEIAEVCYSQASKVQSMASGMSGADYGLRKTKMKTRAAVNIYPNSKEAAKDNYENNTLLKCIK